MFRECVVILIGLYLNEVAMGLNLGNAMYLYRSNLDGYLNTTNVLHNGLSRSKTECAISCEGHQPMCTSFFYVKNSGECKLHSIVFTSITGLTNSLSAKFFERVMCPDGWIYFQGSCYLFDHNRRYRFIGAQDRCEQRSSNLVHIEGSDENNFLKNYLSQFKPANRWIGMTDVDVEDEWRWVGTNTIVNYTDWYPGQPDQKDFANCVALYAEYNYTWVDERCDKIHRPICEKGPYR